MGMFKNLLCKLGIGSCEEKKEEMMESQPQESQGAMEETMAAPEAPAQEQEQSDVVVGENQSESPFSSPEAPESEQKNQ